MRVLSFSFRLFGNVFAGEVLLLVIAFLVPFFLPVPFMVLEVFISLIQAYIFCVLALTYIRLGTQKTLERG
jgi:F-type H+-transporting ATPase subunit a